MPVYRDDPSVLTKERLKSELRAHNVELPGGNPNKDVYVQLYVKAVSAQSHGTDHPDAFSSDEELSAPVGPQTLRSRSGPKPAAALERLDMALMTDEDLRERLDVALMSDEDLREQLDMALMSDEDLREQLLTHGVHAGPIVASTRKLYEKKLLKLLDNGSVLPESQSHGGGGKADAEVYSDQEEEAPTAPESDRGAPPELETVPVKSSSSWPPSAQRRSSSQRSVTTVEQVEKKTAEPPPSQEDTDVPELPEVHSPFTGLTASCRRPIKGSARRPVMRDHSFESKSGVCNSAPTTTSSTNSGPSAASSTPSSTCQARVRSMWGWKKLLLLFVLVALVFLVYQAMEPNTVVPFGQVEEL